MRRRVNLQRQLTLAVLSLRRGRERAVACSFPLPAKRGEGGERRRRETGEGQIGGATYNRGNAFSFGLQATAAPHPALASLGPPSPRFAGRGYRQPAQSGELLAAPISL